MRIWNLKFAGFIIWSLFLLIPFTAQADEGFFSHLPSESFAAAKQPAVISAGTISLQLDSNALKIPVEDQWSLKLNAGEDTVLKSDLPAKIKHDRIPLDNGGRESFRFGIGLNYQF